MGMIPNPGPADCERREHSQGGHLRRLGESPWCQRIRGGGPCQEKKNGPGSAAKVGEKESRRCQVQPRPRGAVQDAEWCRKGKLNDSQSVCLLMCCLEIIMHCQEKQMRLFIGFGDFPFGFPDFLGRAWGGGLRRPLWLCQIIASHPKVPTG